MKLYKIREILYYEIEAENIEEAMENMTNDNISDSWIESYDEEEVED